MPLRSHPTFAAVLGLWGGLHDVNRSSHPFFQQAPLTTIWVLRLTQRGALHYCFGATRGNRDGEARFHLIRGCYELAQEWLANAENGSRR
jgi:hypothetical protein